jgi:hypothetical protein
MIQYKLQQSNVNQESLLIALDKLDKPVSSMELEQYLKKQAVIRAREDFERTQYAGEVGGQDITSYVSSHSSSMNLRTIQRWLKAFLLKGYIVKKHNKYVLSITGKRELQFKQYAQAYGIISLNYIMDFSFPTMNTLDRNLIRLVEIFGIYVVYALIEATRLIATNKKGQEDHWHSSFFGDASNFRDGKFREGRLVNTWIKEVFNPWYMLNMFLTAISNSKNDEKVGRNNAKRQEILMKQRLKEYKKDLSLQINEISIESILNPKINSPEPSVPPSTLDLIIQRVSDLYNIKRAKETSNRNKYLHYFNVRSPWYDNTNLLYEATSKTISKLKNSLNRQYPYSEILQILDELFYSKLESKVRRN